MSFNSNSKDFFPGELVYISLDHAISPDGFMLMGRGIARNYHVYETIQLNNFPSCDDFVGRKIEVRDNHPAIIIEKVGRPLRINPRDEFDYYDVYDVLIEDRVFQVFRYLLVRDKD